MTQGELHNNVRMTWGKAIPAWTRTPEEARRALVAMNHRYALDGRDPSSYGGLYWCLGLFDRPSHPSSRSSGRSGRVRRRCTRAGSTSMPMRRACRGRPARWDGSRSWAPASRGLIIANYTVGDEPVGSGYRLVEFLGRGGLELEGAGPRRHGRRSENPESRRHRGAARIPPHFSS